MLCSPLLRYVTLTETGTPQADRFYGLLNCGKFTLLRPASVSTCRIPVPMFPLPSLQAFRSSNFALSIAYR